MHEWMENFRTLDKSFGACNLFVKYYSFQTCDVVIYYYEDNHWEVPNENIKHFQNISPKPGVLNHIQLD